MKIKKETQLIEDLQLIINSKIDKIKDFNRELIRYQEILIAKNIVIRK